MSEVPTYFGRTRPTSAGDLQPAATFGPFINGGGGDVARGDDIYIDLYEDFR